MVSELGLTNGRRFVSRCVALLEVVQLVGSHGAFLSHSLDCPPGGQGDEVEQDQLQSVCRTLELMHALALLTQPKEQSGPPPLPVELQGQVAIESNQQSLHNITALKPTLNSPCRVLKYTAQSIASWLLVVAFCLVRDVHHHHRSSLSRAITMCLYGELAYQQCCKSHAFGGVFGV